jgi:beta-phosphoglucomutase-like phosphatase (HAD superfamily)
MGDISPANCLVIEDSPLGVKGGVAAGMTAFGYAELMNEERLLNAGAHHIINSMGNLAREISAFKR